MLRLWYAFLALMTGVTLSACQHPTPPVQAAPPDALAYALQWAGPRKVELQHALDHYVQPTNRLKRQALVYLISGLPYQTYWEITDSTALAAILAQAAVERDPDAQLAYLKDKLESLAHRSPAQLKRDVDIIDAAFLIENVDLAFEAWQKPWARQLSFTDFCRYVLPYKSPGEKPQRLRRTFWRQYGSLGDTLTGQLTRRAVCATVCQQLKQQYRFVVEFVNSPIPVLPTAAVTQIKLGRCSELTQLSGDVMRAVGLPVTHDICTWGNHAAGHTWNTLYEEDRQFMPFLFIDGPPGIYKCELMVTTGDDHYRRKRSKVWRYQYLPEPTALRSLAADAERNLTASPLLTDVSASVLSCSDVVVPLATAATTTWPVYLCTFDDRRWAAVSQGVRQGGQAVFRQMGRDLCYLPVQVSPQQQLVPIGPPFILTQTGQLVPLTPDKESRESVRVTAKFPINGSDKIKEGDTYRLVYWQDGWQPLGRQTATVRALTFSNVPTNALLWLQDVDRGKEERIFTYEHNRQVWW